jgi:hypothetical protein
MWVVMPLLLGSLSRYGAFSFFSCARTCLNRSSTSSSGRPDSESDRYPADLHLARSCARLAFGSSFQVLGVREPENPAYENPAIRVL